MCHFSDQNKKDNGETGDDGKKKEIAFSGDIFSRI